MLELDPDAYAGVPCWSKGWAHWAHVTVACAYDLHYATIRPRMCNGGVARKTLILIAAALAQSADYATGRNARASNARIVAATGLSDRQVQRGREALKLLGVATEILRGRKRTRTERFASWRCGDKSRGWASVWALHDTPALRRFVHNMSPHPRSGPVRDKTPVKELVTTDTDDPTGRRQGGAQRRSSPDKGGAALAVAWRAHPGAPPWSRRHSPSAWAAQLAEPARHGWTPNDLNALVTDWLGVGRQIPDSPHKPIGLLGAMLAWHDNPAARPAALDDARTVQESLATRGHQPPAWTAQDRADHQHGRQIGQAALHGPARAAARQVIDDIVRRRRP
ncbi:helix-turn-helix domain-containing protein [Mycolicibacter acidiphilus]|uniref:helix-turn-helix domain-containing protein n=1 Tax=Mycolicibacter acidiphilus TaxID=2835306 RepID=UPI0027DB1F02|nr:helix-turn-helix domain-containing protein [Mycolicibacter acidiphilus]